MTTTIRIITPADYLLLEDFLYEAIFIPEGVDKPDRSIIEHPSLRQFIDDFGEYRGDHGVVAEVDGKVVGAAWSRIREQYGHVDDDTPSLSISLYPDYRGQGIGTQLMHAIHDTLRAEGYRQASLSVQHANPAARLYQRLGYETIEENGDELIMVIKL